MVTLPVLQFVFLLGTLIALTAWFVTKAFLTACTHNATTLKGVLAHVWRRNPDTLGFAMGMLSREDMCPIDHVHDPEVGQSGPIPADEDFTNGNCRHCGQPVPWSARSSEIPPP